ncbi:MAG: penicillin-binding protein activator [Syntrophotaleaceae bacterium]
MAKLNQVQRAAGSQVNWRIFLPILGILAAFLFVSMAAFAAELSMDTTGDLFARGMSLYQSGEEEQALDALTRFVSTDSSSPRSAQAVLVLARIHAARGQHKESLALLKRIPPDRRGPEFKLLQGMAEIKVGRVEQGIAQLKALEEVELAPRDRVKYLEALADGHRYLGRWMESLFFYFRALPLAADEDSAAHYLQQAGDLIANQLSDDQLAEAAFLFEGSPLAQQVGLERAERYFRAGQTYQALSEVVKVLQEPGDFPGRDRAVQLRERLAGSEMPNRTVGVILPLSGRYAAFGKLVQRGIELAAREQVNGEQAVRLIFKDSAADPEASARAVSELANVEQVLGILGPLTGHAAASAAERAELEKVPLLTLSQHRGLPETGPYVFRTSLTNEQQALALARYAVEERNLTRFAILAPENRLGQDLTASFIREVQAHGGRVVAQQTYPETATDFRRQIKLLKGKDPNAPDEKRGSDDKQPVEEDPKLPFEALFIPDQAERVGLIVPQLPFYGLRGVQLLGINGWNSPELLRRGGRTIEGAVFVDGFFPHSDYPFVKDFVNRYFETYGEEPSILEAQGYDAAGIILSLAGRSNTRSREDLRNALSIVRNYPGVTGATSFDLEGDARKVLFLLQVQNGAIVQIN